MFNFGCLFGLYFGLGFLLCIVVLLLSSVVLAWFGGVLCVIC